tara:strand:- start:8387 stop:8545 length:159 start_codon:yes stop_codon:yes gene_type:complete
MTPLDEFRELVPEGHNLTEEQLIAMRDLFDLQVDLILDSWIASKTDHDSPKL